MYFCHFPFFPPHFFLYFHPFLVKSTFAGDDKMWHAEEGKGSINVQDLAKVAIAHDFTWTDNQLVDMIRFFDTDGDGKVKTFQFPSLPLLARVV